MAQRQRLGYSTPQKDAKKLRVMLTHAGMNSSGGIVSFGSEWTYPGNMTIDANSASDTTLTVTNDGAGDITMTVNGDAQVTNLGIGVAPSATYGLYIMDGDVLIEGGTDDSPTLGFKGENSSDEVTMFGEEGANPAVGGRLTLRVDLPGSNVHSAFRVYDSGGKCRLSVNSNGVTILNATGQVGSNTDVFQVINLDGTGRIFGVTDENDATVPSAIYFGSFDAYWSQNSLAITGTDARIGVAAGGLGAATQRVLISAGTSAGVPLTLKGAASQSANLTEWQDSSANILLSVEDDGKLVLNSSGAQTISTDSGDLTVAPAADLTLGTTGDGEYITVSDSTGVKLFGSSNALVHATTGGNVLVGNATPGYPRLQYDGTDIFVYAAANDYIHVDADVGVKIYGNSVQQFQAKNDGSGWLGNSTALTWDTSQVVSLTAESLTDPWEIPSLLDALYLSNKDGGGMRMWGWEAVAPVLYNGYGVDPWVLGVANDWTRYGCTSTGGPYYTLSDVDENAMKIEDAAWQEVGAYNFLVWAWVYGSSLDTDDRPIISKWLPSTNARSWVLYWDQSSADFSFNVSGNGTNTFQVDSSYSESTSTWYFVAGFYDPSTRIRVYVGAATDSSLTTDDNTTSIPASLHDGAADLFLGSYDPGAGSATYWDGYIGPTAAWRGIPAANINDYVDLVFTKTKQYYGG